VKQESPPPTHLGTKYTDWTKIVRTLKSKPHSWHLVGEFSVGIPNHLRKGVYRQFLDPADPAPPEVQMKRDWEITSRRIPESDPLRTSVYIRYVGAT
jgi:hypothetical protein